MKNKQITITLILIILLIPMIGYAQTPTSNNYNGLLQFLKGDGAFEKWFMQVFTKLETEIFNQASAAALFGRGIGGFGALCYLGYLGWQMQEGARPWEVTPMLRPFFIGIILIYWTSFVNMIRYPFEKLAEPSTAIFENLEKESNNLRVIRFQKQNELLDALIKKRAEEEAKQEALDDLKEETDGGLLDIGEGVDKLTAPIKEWFLRMDFQLQKLVADVIEAVALTILRVCTYLMFFIQKIWSYVLIILGPIAVGFALIPGFENSLTNWVAKFVNINLYTFVTYTIINIGQQLIMAGQKMEIERYDLLMTGGTITDYSTLLFFIQSNGMIYISLFTCVAYIITGIGVLMTPSIADSIVSGGGAGIMSKMKGATETVMSSGKAVATGGKSIIVRGASAASTTAKNNSASGMVANAIKK